ncbi:MAG TPA: phosphoesterase [Acetobacteraceae bacterium]|nr:phosphoesterase [Acetobacteraceae bacterium]
MAAAPVHVAGERLLLDPEGALFWPREGVLALADLSLRGTGARERFHPAPGRGAGSAGEETIKRLAALLRRWRPRLVLVLGVMPERPGRLPPGLSSRLAAMASAHPFVWVYERAGGPAPLGEDRRKTAEFWESPPLIFRPRPAQRAAGEIAGHLRPVSAPAGAPAPARPCFVVDGQRVLLPAFGPEAGGMDAHQPAIQALFPHGARVFLLGAERLSSFPVVGRPIIGRRARRWD